MTATTTEVRPNWMLVRRGHVQHVMTPNPITGEMEKSWPVARSHQDAKRLAKFLGRPGVVPARIGSIEGETFEAHVLASIEHGCIRAIMPLGWRNGKPSKWAEMSFD